MTTRRRRLTKTQREELWARFADAALRVGISESLSRSLSEVYGVVQASGGVRPPSRLRGTAGARPGNAAYVRSALVPCRVKSCEIATL